MRALFKALSLVAAGAATMYFLDPETGRRRRALVRDKGAAARRDLEASARATRRDAANRLRGAAAEMDARMDAGMDDAPVSDDILEARIRSKLGHLVEQPGDVDIEVDDGYVVLSGSASAEEMDALARTVAAMPGVSEVENRMDEGGAAATH